jgi:hypothetical protein
MAQAQPGEQSAGWRARGDLVRHKPQPAIVAPQGNHLAVGRMGRLVKGHRLACPFQSRGDHIQERKMANRIPFGCAGGDEFVSVGRIGQVVDNVGLAVQVNGCQQACLQVPGVDQPHHPGRERLAVRRKCHALKDNPAQAVCIPQRTNNLSAGRIPDFYSSLVRMNGQESTVFGKRHSSRHVGVLRFESA